MNIDTLISEPGVYAPSLPRYADTVNLRSGQGAGDSQAGKMTGTRVEDRIERPESNLVRIQNVNEEITQLARQNNSATDALTKLEDYIDGMKAELEQIVKTYPPYPAGSEERVRALRSYYGFRQLIDKLTIPPSLAGELSAMTGLVTNSAPDANGGDAGTGS